PAAPAGRGRWPGPVAACATPGRRARGTWPRPCPAHLITAGCHGGSRAGARARVRGPWRCAVIGPMQMQLRLYPGPLLLKVAAPVTAFDAALAERVEEMLTIMYEEKGVGLAAPQVGWGERVLVMNPSGHRREENQKLAVINPRALKRWGRSRAEEGCLS